MSTEKAQPGQDRPRALVVVARWVELVLLFIAIPGAFWWSRLNQATVSGWLEDAGVSTRAAASIARGSFMFPTLFAFAAGCLLFLVFEPSFRKRRLWNLRAGIREIPRILLIFVPLAGVLSLLIWFLQPGSSLVAEAAEYGLMLPTLDPNAAWLHLPRERPELWVAIMVLYPIFSVWPQEVIYRAFFHHRYEPILRAPTTRIIVGGAVFGFMHVVFLNWLAPAMTFVGGLLFAWTYERSKSLVGVTIEHALWGCYVFTIGIGWYFFGGAIQPPG